ncbi:10201_t:CDS:2 [Funneliformis geosporum]|nr:10201_t:CDS:2 [Funneliformis geosporum]
MCNDKFYEQLKKRFATPTNSIAVVPLDKFKKECSKLGAYGGAIMLNVQICEEYMGVGPTTSKKLYNPQIPRK